MESGLLYHAQQSQQVNECLDAELYSYANMMEIMKYHEGKQGLLQRGTQR